MSGETIHRTSSAPVITEIYDYEEFLSDFVNEMSNCAEIVKKCREIFLLTNLCSGQSVGKEQLL